MDQHCSPRRGVAPPAARRAVVSRAPPTTARLRPLHLVGIGLFAALAAINLGGLSYYVLPAAQRVRSPHHGLFNSTGLVGQTLGIVAFLMFLFMWLYPMRKRIPGLRGMGALKGWLEVHILVGLALPVIAATHASWRFQGLIGLGYGLMLTVSLSGVVGRYLYLHLPRSSDGTAMSLERVNARRVELVNDLAARLAVPAATIQVLLEDELAPERRQGNYLSTLKDLVSADLDRFRLARRLRRRLSQISQRPLARSELRPILKDARREIALTQQLRMLAATQAIFRFWHVAHMPFAITALAALTVHVLAAIVLGVTWLG